DSDDDGAGRDHRDGDGVEELAIVEPMALVDDSTAQEWHDCKAAADHEHAGLAEVGRALRQRRPGRDPTDPLQEPRRWASEREHCRPRTPTWWSFDHQRQHAT